jgi:hypothetical protein
LAAETKEEDYVLGGTAGGSLVGCHGSNHAVRKLRKAALMNFKLRHYPNKRQIARPFGM